MSTARGSIELVWIDLRPETPDLEILSAVLSPEERERVDRMAHPDLRRRRILCRHALRMALGARLGIRAEQVPLRTGPHGKPYLEPRIPDGNTEGRWHFNLSHTDHLALLAIGDRELGVDLEELARLGSMEPGPVADRFFAPEERAVLRTRTPGVSRDIEFLRIWTRKEALIKAVGRGLHCPLDAFAVPTGPLPTDGTEVDCPEGTARRWRLFDVPRENPGGLECVAALAVAVP
jgi:4'-phosphopantetheinyl transferase